MTDDLRARIITALATTPEHTAAAVWPEKPMPRTPHGVHSFDFSCAMCAGDIEALADAVMMVVEADRIHAFHNPRGRCRWCNVITSEVLARGRGLKPHRMKCRFYVGPVEHCVVGGYQAFTHWATECSCGQSWDTEQSDVCPNSAETWRGSVPEVSP